jgi:signal transduction histidine kinase
MAAWLIRLVARVPAPIHAKLLAAFLAIVVLLIVVGAAGLQALTGANRRAEELVTLQRKIAAYRQLQHDTTAQLHAVDSALLAPDERTLESTLRQLNQFGYDLDRLRFVARAELELLGQAQEDYEQFIRVVTRVVELIRAGEVAEGQALQVAQAGPLADRLERLTNQLVNRAEADMVAQIEANQAAYAASRWLVIAAGLGSIALALGLGYAISWSVIGPVKQMEARLRALAAGDFSRRVEVPNRDELGALAADLNRMSEELGRLYAQLETANRHKSEFLANMSHELRTPLNAVIGFSEVLLERLFGELNEKQAEYLQDILTSGQHLLELINEILDLSKVEAGRMELELEPCSLPEVLESGLVMLRERAGRRGIVLSLRVDPALGVIEADARKVKQVLFNLLSNAVKFTPDGGRVDVSARLVPAVPAAGAAGGEGAAPARGADDEVQVAVRDTGIGIAPEDRDRIFEAFRQSGQGSTARHEGTGLGLTLAKQFVELHGGRIWVESEVGAGSTFTFALPLRQAGAPAEAVPLPEPGASAAARADAAVA